MDNDSKNYFHREKKNSLISYFNSKQLDNLPLLSLS